MSFDAELAARCFAYWRRCIKKKDLARRKSMIRTVVSLRGDSSAIRRMCFRDWVNLVSRKRKAEQVVLIRTKIALRKRARVRRVSLQASTRGSPASKSLLLLSESGREDGDGYTLDHLVEAVESIQGTQESIKGYKEMGSFTDEDQEKIDDGEKVILSLKQQIVARLNKQGKEKKFTANTIAPEAESEQEELLSDFFENLIVETDIRPGNLELASAFLQHVGLDYGTLCEDRGLMAVAACDGSLGYLRVLLEAEAPRGDAVEIVSSCMFNQGFRIPLVALVLKHAEKKLQLPEVKDDLADTWNEFFADISSRKRMIQREDRHGRLQLIQDMIHYTGIPINLQAEGPDCQTVLSRAAHEGDAELVELLLGVEGTGKDRVQSDTTTTLIQAVISGSVDTVKVIMAHKPSESHINHMSEHGTAMELARILQRDTKIVKLIDPPPEAVKEPVATTAPLPEPVVETPPQSEDKPVVVTAPDHDEAPSSSPPPETTPQVQDAKPVNEKEEVEVPRSTQQDSDPQILAYSDKGFEKAPVRPKTAPVRPKAAPANPLYIRTKLRGRLALVFVAARPAKKKHDKDADTARKTDSTP